MWKIVIISPFLLLAVVLFLHTRANVAQHEAETPDTEKIIAPDLPPLPSSSSSNLEQNKTLDLSGQELTEVPKYIFDHPEIVVLDLANNYFKGAIQAEIRHLKNIQILNLSDNEFTGLPAEIGQLENLEVLNLANNKLTGLPHELGNLQKLRILNLSGNPYSKEDLEIIKKKLPESVKIQTE